MPDGTNPIHGRQGRLASPLGAAALCGLVAVLSACSDDTTGPDNGEWGTMDATARDGGEAAQGAQHTTFDLGAETDENGEVNGQITGNATVEVRTETGAWEEVGTLADLDLEAELRASDGSAMGSGEVEARTYEGVRIVLDSAEAELEAGSAIGVGPIEVDVTLDIAGGGAVMVEHDAPFTVEAGATTDIVLDVNSHVWLDEESVEAEAVTAAEFESAATILVE